MNRLDQTYLKLHIKIFKLSLRPDILVYPEYVTSSIEQLLIKTVSRLIHICRYKYWWEYLPFARKFASSPEHETKLIKYQDNLVQK